MYEYTPNSDAKAAPRVIPHADGSFALGGKVTRKAKPPVRPKVVIPEATPKQYEWAHKNGHAALIDRTEVEVKKTDTKADDKKDEKAKK